MTDNSHSSASAPPTPKSPPNPLKRKEISDEAEPKPLATSNPLPPENGSLPEEYKNGHIVCQVCGLHVNIRDEESGGFTVKMWEDHRAACFPPSTSSREAVIYTPESTAEALAHPPTKRRRAKRTEEERIDYLRADPYVAQFEAYRVLCASCDKWIRLRPNSTYCSIPWDAHRKSCLAKKINNKNAYALEERNNIFSKDTDIRKFDAERLLCNRCDQWMSVSPDDHHQAVQKWLQHRVACNKSTSSSALRPIVKDIPRAPPLSETQLALASASAASAMRSSVSSSASPSSPKPIANLHGHPPKYSHPNPASPSFHDLNPTNYAPIHESRRRNAEQRAETLRKDHLIGEVEPNRVFCTLCQKWVQLRQDSSFCAYPWIQHRGKCLARHQRRAHKAAEIAELKARRQQAGQNPNDDDDELMSEDSSDLESEDEMDLSHAEEDRRKREAASTSKVAHRQQHQQHQQHHGGGEYYHHPRTQSGPPPSSIPIHHHSKSSRPQNYSSPYSFDRSAPVRRQDPWRNVRESHSSSRPSTSTSAAYSQAQAPRRVRNAWEDDMDPDADADADGESYLEDDPPPPPPRRSMPVRRPYPVGLADLDSPTGRRQFVSTSIEYLFGSTYESTDDMSISALLTYLNAAMPQDKHEDFDTAEVVRYVAALKERGQILFQGDIIRLVG